MASITGIKTNLYAPPYGEYNNTVLLAAQEIDYTTIMWSIDTIDWKRPPPEVIKERVLKKTPQWCYYIDASDSTNCAGSTRIDRRNKEAGIYHNNSI